ncbi:hypothetical protein Barb7_02676 [Bacteroidales bacterium Barb7]|nr:hypothetical protein Barb7_02676 [Bacteroidales bacterium Barb7]
MPEASHCKISAIAIRVPFIHGFPKRISGSIDMYEANCSMTFLKYVLAKIWDYFPRILLLCAETKYLQLGSASRFLPNTGYCAAGSDTYFCAEL